MYASLIYSIPINFFTVLHFCTWWLNSVLHSPSNISSSISKMNLTEYMYNYYIISKFGMFRDYHRKCHAPDCRREVFGKLKLKSMTRKEIQELVYQLRSVKKEYMEL